MSVLVCGGKLTYPIKVSTDKLGIIGVSYVEELADYLKFNQHISKVIFLETTENTFNEDDLYGFVGTITVLTNEKEKYEGVEEDQGISEETKEKIEAVKPLEGLRISDIQWEIMNS